MKKLQVFLIIVIVPMLFSCHRQTTSAPNAQELIVPKISEAYEINAETNNSSVDVDLLTETKPELYTDDVITEEDIANALRTWTRARSFPFNRDSIDNIVFGNGRFLATGHIHIPLAYSDDGDTWRHVRDPLFNRAGVRAIAYGNGRFVAAVRGDRMVFSEDGISWMLAENGGLSADYSISAIVYGIDRFIAVGSNWHQGYGIIGYSNDGETWTLVEAGGLGIRSFISIAYGKGMFIAGGLDGNVAYSNDGIVWRVIENTPFGGRDIHIITYGNGRFVIYCYYFKGRGMTFYSENGMDWTIAPNPFVTSPVHNIVYVNGFFIAAGNSSRISFSFDAKTWHSGHDRDGFSIHYRRTNLHGIAYGNL